MRLLLLVMIAAVITAPAQAFECTLPSDTSPSLWRISVDVDPAVGSPTCTVDPWLNTPSGNRDIDVALYENSIQLSNFHTAGGQPSPDGITILSVTPQSNYGPSGTVVAIQTTAPTFRFESEHVINNVTYTLIVERFYFTNDSTGVLTSYVVSARVFGGSFGLDSSTPDTISPTLSFLDVPTVIGSTSERELTVVFDEPIYGFAANQGDVVVTNGTASGPATPVSETEYRVPFTPDGMGDVTIELPNNVVQDNAGNGNVGNSVTITFDPTAEPDIRVTTNAGNLISNGTGVLDVGTVEFDQESVVRFTVHNDGTGDLEVERPTVSTPTNARDVAETTTNSSFLIPPGSSRSLDIAFTPEATGPFSFDVLVESDDPNDAYYTFHVSGDAAASALVPMVTVTANDDALGIGETTTLLFDLNVESNDFDLGDITYNIGNITDFAQVPGTNQYQAIYTPPTDFESPTATPARIVVQAGTFSNLVGVLNQNGGGGQNAVTIEVDTIAPMADAKNDGPKMSGETVTLDGTGSSDGNGIDIYSWEQVDAIGSLDLLATPDELQVLIVDDDTSQATFTAPDVTVATDLYFALEVLDPFGNAETAWTTVKINPPATTAPDIQIVTNGGGEIPSDGTGVHDLGTVYVDATQVVVYAIKNNGDTDLQVTAMNASNESNIDGQVAFFLDDVAYSSPSTFTIAPNGQQLIATVFQPDTAGSFSFDVTLRNDDADKDPYTFQIKGEASAEMQRPTISLTSTDDELSIGETTEIQFTLSAASNDFDAGDVNVTGGALSDFEQVGTTSAYRATFTPENDYEGNAVINVRSAAFANTQGIQNQDGDDADNTVTIAVDTVAPMAAATNSGDATSGETVTLDGTGSSDGNGIDSYQWFQVDAEDSTSAPQDGTPYLLNNAGTAETSFSAPDVLVATDFHFLLVVVDPFGNEANAWTTVRINPPGPGIRVLNAAGTEFLDDGTDKVGTANAGVPKTITYIVENTGLSVLTIRDITVDDQTTTNIDGAVTISPTTFTLGVGSTRSFAATFTPETVGSAFSFDLDIESNDATTSTFDLTVEGTAVADEDGPQATKVDFHSSHSTHRHLVHARQTIWLFFQTDEDHTVTAPKVTFYDSADNVLSMGNANASIDVAKEWEYYYDVLDTDPDGPVRFVIDLTDDDGLTKQITGLLFDEDGLGVTIDNTPPTIALSSDTNDLEAGGTALITFELSEPSPNFTKDSVVVPIGEITDPVYDAATGTYTATFTAEDGYLGDALITVASDAFTDMVGHANHDGEDEDNSLTIKIVPAKPVLAEVTPVATLGNNPTPSYTFSSTQSGTIAYSGTCVSSTHTSAVAGDNEVIFDSLDDGTYDACSIAVTDAYGTVSLPLSITAFTIDATAPTVDSIEWEAIEGSNEIAVTVVFSEPVAGFDAEAGLDVANATVSQPEQITEGDGTTYTLILTPSEDSDGTLQLQVMADAVTDAAGNGNVESETIEIIFDTLPPTVTLSADKTDLNMNEKAAILFTLSEASTTFGLDDVTVSGGTLTEFAGSGAAYTAIFTPSFGEVSAGGVGTIYVAAGGFEDAYGNANLASDVLEIDFSGAIVERTSNIIQNFISRRADQITASEPDLSTRLNRGGAGDQTAGNWTGDGNGGTQNRMSFNTSLAQVRAWQQRDKRAPNMEDADAFGFGARPFAQTHGETSGDIWLSGSIARTDNEFTTSALGLLHGGFDFALNDDFVLGLMGQLDWIEEENDTDDYSASGLGWMAGPYLVARLDNQLVVDARIAWGQSDNDVSPFDTYEDEFETERLLFSGKVTGSAQFSKASLRPQIGLIYFEETQLAYDDSNGIYIASQDISLGRLTFSPNLSQSWAQPDGTSFSMNWNLKGIWDFDTADLVDVDTGLLARSDAELRGPG
ncbi:MAG: autotransporter outer membrane beta-barrel domain-containing protein [Henriciella sp.]|nr:autotransporter outer membrane beta-barrel domain-containing protein [Henriciella sp.]